MTLLWMEGFESMSSFDDWMRGGGQTATTAIDFTGGYKFGQSILLDASQVPFRSMAQTSDFVHGFYFIIRGPTLLIDIIQYNRSDTEQLVLGMTVAGELTIARGSTVLQTSSGLGMVQDVWYHIEVKCSIDTAFGAFEVNVDDVQVLVDSNINTQNVVGFDYINNVRMRGWTSTDPEYDHMYFMNQDGSKNNDFLGKDTVVETILPDDDGNVNDWTAVGAGTTNADRIKEPLPDDLTTYVTSSTVDDTELYTFQNIGRLITVVHGVQVRCLATKELSTGAGNRSLRMMCRSGGADYEGVEMGMSYSWKYYEDIFELDPDGDIDWDEDSVNLAEFGFTIES